jgi:microcystin-dependent protein
MSEPYVGEIRMFGGTFAPVGWEFCNGQLLTISENDALYTLLGTAYGGDGQTTFGLPDLRGRLPVHIGQNPATRTNYTLGSAGGVESVTLTSQQMPVHSHPANALSSAGTLTSPQTALWAAGPTTYSTNPPTAAMAGDAVAATGGSQPHDNTMPFLCVSFIIALVGIYPSQS